MDRTGVQSRELRLAFGLLVILLVVISLVTLYRYGESATDENLFTEPPSRLVAARDIPAIRSDSGSVSDPREALESGQAMQSGQVALVTDTIRAGSYVIAAGGVKVMFREDLKGSGSRDSVFRIETILPAVSKPRGYVIAGPFAWDSLFREVPFHALVIDVAAGGASDRAGMKIGDKIVAINGSGFSTVLDADRLMRRGESGRALAYDVLRGGERKRLDVTMARFGFSLTALMMTFSGLITLGIGGFLLLKRPGILAARLLGLSFLCAGFVFSLALVRREADPDAITAVRQFLMAGSYLVMFPLIRDVSAVFPLEIPALVSRRRKLVPLYLAALAGAVGSTLLLWSGLHPIFQDVILFMGGPLVIGIPAGIFLLVWRKHYTPEYRAMNRVIRITGWSIFVVNITLVVFLFLFQAASLAGFLSVSILAFPLSHLYTIGRYRLLDLQLRVRRNVQYAMVSSLWMVAAVVGLGLVLLKLTGMEIFDPRFRLVGLSLEITDSPAGAPGGDTGARWVLLGLGIIAFIGTWKLRGFGQSIIDRLFHRRQTDYSRAASSLAEAFSTQSSMLELGRGITRRLVEILQLKRSAILLFNEDGTCCCHEAQGVDADAWQSACVRVDETFVAAVQKFSGEFRVDYLPTPIKERFVAAEFQFLIPIRSRDRLVGVLLLGEKLSESPYSEEEMEFLSAASRQASVAIENAFLYEELAESERMKHELRIARRIQLASLPQKTPVLADLDLAGVSLPAREVGGDFFDFLVEGENRVTVVVGDVSGKGTSAALYMAKIQGILRSLHAFHLPPCEMFTRANALLRADMERNAFVTAVSGVFDADAGSLVIARAGHLPVYMVDSAAGNVVRLAPGGLGLGLDDGAAFSSSLEERTLTIRRGDLVLFVTDGVTEARNGEGEEFGEERLVAFLRGAGALTASEIRDALLKELEEFSGGQEADDDRTVVVVRAGKTAPVVARPAEPSDARVTVLS